MSLKKSFLLLSLFFLLCGCGKKPPLLPSEKAVYHNNRGVTYLAQGDLDRAEFELLTAIELNQKYAEARNNLALVYKTKGEYKKALQELEKALKIDENYASAHSQIGVIYLDQGKIDEAITQLQTAIKKDPTAADTHYNLGLAWMKKAEEENRPEYKKKAEESWKKATELNPDLDYVHLRMAEYYRESGDFDLAIIRYRLAISANPIAETWVRLGTLYLQKGDSFKAQNCFQEASQIDPNSKEALANLGIFFMEQKRFDEAEGVYQAIIQQYPFDEQAYFHLGLAQIHLAEGDSAYWKKAIDSFAKAKEANPDFSDASYNLGWAYLKSGDALKAREEWEYTLTINPNHLQTLYNLGTLEQRQEERGKTATYFCRFLKTEKGEFPAERKIVEQVLNQMGGSCQD